MWNEVLGNQYKGFAIEAQRPNIYLYTKSYKTQIKRMPLIKCQPKIILYASYSESVRAKWFCSAFTLGPVHLICKVSLIFKSNLE